LQVLDRSKPNLDRVESVFVDGGCTHQLFADGVKERLEATVQVIKRNQLHTIAVLPKRSGCRTVLRMAGEVPLTLRRTPKGNSIRVCSLPPCLPRVAAEEIVNRLQAERRCGVHRFTALSNCPGRLKIS
jgi:hypothetical protein